MEENNNISNQQPTQTVAQPSPESHISIWAIILALILFPPLAFVLIYKDRKYHMWFFSLLLVMSVISLLLFLSMLIFVLPQMTLLYQNLEIPYPNTTSYLILGTGILYFIAVFAFSFIYKSKLKENALNTKNWVRSALALLILSYVLLSTAPIVSVAMPTYNLISQIDTPEQIACELDAKICPDGTSVGRIEPKCEFAPCPTALPDLTDDWQTYNGGAFTFRYPKDYKLEETADLIKLEKSLVLPTNCWGCLNYTKLNIEIQEIQSYQTIEEFVKADYGTRYGQELEFSIEKIPNNQLEIISIPTGMHTTDYYYLLNKHALIVSTEVGYGNIEEELYQILSTFEFIN